MISFGFPLALVLLFPAILAWWRWGRTGLGRWLRLCALIFGVLALALPMAVFGRGGRDLIVVVDRSDSLGERRESQAEILRLLARSRSAGDRLSAVACADGAMILGAPSTEPDLSLRDIPLKTEASDLAAGLERASALLDPRRSSRLLLISDGEATEAGTETAAARIPCPIDVLPQRSRAADDAVVNVELPRSIRLGESFVGLARLTIPSLRTRKCRVFRGDLRIAEETLSPRTGGEAQIRFADRPDQGGVAAYRVELDTTDDPLPANNTAQAVLRITGGERVLVMGIPSQTANIVRMLEATGIRAGTCNPGPLTLSDLTRAQALVLVDVPASDIGHESMTLIRDWVRAAGGGLVMTGGRRSFGAGGYRRSPLEDILPVSLELRDEHRKLSVAIAITMDRSGSMACPAADGRPKIQLADEGACAAIEMLGPRDQVAVLATDSESHLIVPMQSAENRGKILAETRGIVSMGGGIYIYNALRGAGEQIAKSKAGARHVLLFADAADSEEPGDYKKLLKDFAAAGVTVSVIGMGTEKDCDAQLLKDIAAAGGGRIHFTDRAEDLPRLFALETMTIARTAWVGESAPIVTTPALLEILGPQTPRTWPTVGGYNLTYPRSTASVLSWLEHDPRAPAAATIRAGAGRTAILGIDATGAIEPTFATWKEAPTILSGLVRWCAGNPGDPPGRLDAVLTGKTAVFRLEMDPRARAQFPSGAIEATLIGQEKTVPLIPVQDGIWEGQIRLSSEAPVLPSVQIGGSVLLGPALCLPCAPELAPRLDQVPGHVLLDRLARRSGGQTVTSLDGIWDRIPQSTGQNTALWPWCLLAALILTLAAIAVLRLHITLPSIQRQKTSKKPIVPIPSPVTLPTQTPIRADSVSNQTKSPPPPPTSPPPPPANTDGIAQALRSLKKR